MILRGGPRLGYASYTNYLAPHLQRVDTNESVVIREIRGTAANDVRGALREMAAYGVACGCKKSVYHLSLNAGPAEAPLSEAQTLRTVDLSEEKLGLGGQPRIVVQHIKNGRIHLHVVWGRIHRETLRPISSSFNYRRHEVAARQLEEEFGHAWVQGAHVGRDGVTRPKRRLSDVELRQADRSGLDLNLIRAAVIAIWRSSDNGRAFRTAVETQGFVRGAKSRAAMRLDIEG